MNTQRNREKRAMRFAFEKVNWVFPTQGGPSLFIVSAQRNTAVENHCCLCQCFHLTYLVCTALSRRFRPRECAVIAPFSLARPGEGTPPCGLCAGDNPDRKPRDARSRLNRKPHGPALCTYENPRVPRTHECTAISGITSRRREDKSASGDSCRTRK